MKPEFKPLLDQMLLGKILGGSKRWILVKMVDIFVNTFSFLSQFCSGLAGQSLMVRAIWDLWQLGVFYTWRHFTGCTSPVKKEKKRKKDIIYYLNSIQHSKFVTPGVLCHMCSPFNHLHDFVNYGPLPASFVQSRLTLVSWQEGWTWPLFPSPWVPAGGSLASLQSHLHCTLKCWSRNLPGWSFQRFSLFSVWCKPVSFSDC